MLVEFGVVEQRHVPLLGEAGVARFVNGPITYSPDASPLVGSAAEGAGFRGTSLGHAAPRHPLTGSGAAGSASVDLD